MIWCQISIALLYWTAIHRVIWIRRLILPVKIWAVTEAWWLSCCIWLLWSWLLCSVWSSATPSAKRPMSSARFGHPVIQEASWCGIIWWCRFLSLWSVPVSAIFWDTLFWKMFVRACITAATVCRLMLHCGTRKPLYWPPLCQWCWWQSSPSRYYLTNWHFHRWSFWDVIWAEENRNMRCRWVCIFRFLIDSASGSFYRISAII